ncbi:MAG: hypothetical protein MUF00_21140 [Gemmatimonadaceae bacterium]|nr:hypothetical protein [Gemmatimonadaceae bacterium]
MPSSIFHVDPNDRLTALQETLFESEALLQQLLARFPQILSGEADDGPSPTWLLVTREMPVPDDATSGGRWSLDHLFLDHRAIPTLVEVKRSTDLRIRREVVGQMLDYAANAVTYIPVERLQEALRRRCTDERIDMSDALQPVLMASGLSETDWWHAVKTNLQAGRIRLVFVADIVPPPLRRIVEFLNEQMDPAEVLAIEVRQYVGATGRTLVPSLVGRTAVAERRKSVGTTASGEPWTEARFFATLEEVGAPEAERQAARALLHWAEDRRLRVWWGSGSTFGSFVPVLDRGSESYQLFAVRTNRLVELQFQWLAPRPALTNGELLEALRTRFNAITGVHVPLDRMQGRPTVPLSALANASSRDAFLAAWDEFLSALPPASSTSD